MSDIEIDEIFEVDYNPPFHKIGEEILKLFRNGQHSANENNNISLINCIQEYIFKSHYSEEEILDILEDDNIFKNILYTECIKDKHLKEENIVVVEDMTDIKLWECVC